MDQNLSSAEEKKPYAPCFQEKIRKKVDQNFVFALTRMHHSVYNRSEDIENEFMLRSAHREWSVGLLRA